MADGPPSHFEIQEEIPEFGPGQWFRALDRRNGQVVALTILPKAAGAESPPGVSPDALLVPVLEHGATAEGRGYLTTPYAAGRTLQSRLRRHLPSIRESINIVRAIAISLKNLRSAGRFYGPLDPSLVQLTPGGEVRLLPPLCRTEGAARYEAPEVTAGAPSTIRSDVWSLGVLLYTAVSGTPPFAHDDPAEMAYAIRFEQPLPVRARRRGVPPAVERIIQLAMAKRPEHRYQSLGDFVSDLEAVADGRVPLVATPHRVALAAHRTRGTVRRGVPPLLRMTLIASALVLLVGVAYVLFQGRPPWSGLGTGPDRVAVIPFHDFTYRLETRTWPSLVQRQVALTLESAGTVQVLTPDSINAAMRSRVGTSEARRGRWLFELLEDLEVPYLVDGGIFLDGERYLLRGQLVQRWSREVLVTDTAGFDHADGLAAASSRLAATMLSFLEGDSLGVRVEE